MVTVETGDWNVKMVNLVKRYFDIGNEAVVMLFLIYYNLITENFLKESNLIYKIICEEI